MTASAKKTLSYRPRREIVFDFGGASSGIRLSLTRKGVEVSGWYDHIVGIESGFLSWADFDEARKELE